MSSNFQDDINNIPLADDDPAGKLDFIHLAHIIFSHQNDIFCQSFACYLFCAKLTFLG